MKLNSSEHRFINQRKILIIHSDEHLMEREKIYE